MKNLKKFISLNLSLTLLFMIILSMPLMPSSAEDAKTAYYKSFTGIVEEIRFYVDTNGVESDNSMFITVKAGDKVEDEEVVVFFVTDETYMITEHDVKVGSKVTGFYETNGIALMIYPPQYTAAALAVDLSADQTVKADRFDENLISYDGMLKLNLGDKSKTEVINQNGTAFEGDISNLANRKLVVIYDVSTRSIPAITIPLKVIVLYEKAVNPIAPIDTVNILEFAEQARIWINGEITEVPESFYLGDSDDTHVLLPLRAVAEALGYEVVWIPDTSIIILDDIISLTIGDNIVHVEDELIELSIAPLLIDNRTYVPAEFFTNVLKFNIIGNTRIIE